MAKKLTKDNVIQLVHEARQQYNVNVRTKDFDEYLRHALGYPPAQEKEGAARVAEGTTATLVREIPLVTLPDVPVCRIKSSAMEQKIITEFFINKVVIPKVREQAPFKMKGQLWLEQACTFGLQFAQITIKEDEKYGYLPDYRLPYPGFTYFDPEASSAYDINWIAFDTYHSVADIDHMEAEEKTRRENGGKKIYNLTALRRSKENTTSKDTSTSSYIERRSTESQKEYVLITKVITKDVPGKNTKIYYIAPNGERGEVIGEEDIEDYYGEMPIVPLYFKLFFNKPYGMGIPEMTNDIQNALDDLLGYAVWGHTMDTAPMLFMNGVDPTNVDIYPFATVIGDGEQNTQVAPISLGTPTLQNLPAILAFYRQLMYTRIGAQDTGIVAPQGTLTSSKTPAGVNALQNKLAAIYDALREQCMEAHAHLFRIWIYGIYHNKSGKEKLELDDDTMLKLQEILDPKEYDKRAGVDKKTKKNQYEVNWDDYDKELLDDVYMEVNPEFKADRAKKVEEMLKLLPLLNQDPSLGAIVNKHGLMSEYLKAMDMRTDGILVDKEELAPHLQFLNQGVLDQMARVAQEQFGKQVTEAQMRPSDTSTDAIKALWFKLTGHEIEGELKLDKELEMKDRAINITEEQMRSKERIEMAKIELEKLKLGIQPAQAPQDTSQAPQSTQVPQNTQQAPQQPQEEPQEGDRLPPEEVERRTAELVATAEQLGASQEQIDYLVNLNVQMNMAKTEEERTQIAQQIEDELNKLQGGNNESEPSTST